MFNWFRPKCPVQPDVKAWVEQRMCWLVGQFGRERLLEGEVILPIEEHFPDPYDGSEADARILLDRVCRYVDIDPASVDLLFYSERRPVALNADLVRPEGGTAGLYNEQNGRTTIWLEVSHLADPISVAATFAHELCHAHLLGGGRISAEEDDHEPLTDLATVYFGMGVFMANATLRDKNYHFGNWEGWTISRQGYLTAPVLAYALALFAWLRQESQPDWADYLRLDARSPFRKALSYLANTQGAVLLPAEVHDAEPPACPADLRRQLGIQPSQGAAADRDSVADDADTTAESDAMPLEDRFTQAAFLMRKGLWKDAVQLLSEVLADEPQDGEAYQQRALAYLKLGMCMQALVDAEKAVQCLPDDSESYRVRGMTYLDAQQHTLAIADFTRFLKAEDHVGTNPARPGEVYHLRGTAYAKLGQLSEAAADFGKAIRRWPQRPAPYESRAEVYERLGKTKKALADRKEAAERTESFGRHEPVPERQSIIPHLPGIH